ncbi:MAG TPA: cobalt ECF transporter T component CbiQ [Candidatus Limnocylindrales bacterium]|jgi:cobalt/nickel transport system permease protein|nr:cobalt ECF transporter T component CbiQ [Candidatus Limnocylindrales bacterium]
MDLDRAVAGNSPLHRADPRLKFVAVVATIVSISLLPVGAFVALGIMWVALAAASTLAQLGPLRLTRGGFIAAPFLLAVVPIVFVRPEDPIGSIGPLTVSGEGLRIFGTVAAKSWLSVQAALLLTFTTPFHDLVDALRDLRVPRILVSIIGFMYRYLAVLVDEGGRMLRARSARSAGTGGGSIRWRARVTGQMVGTLFLRSYERSERIYAAMQARGFSGAFRHLATRPIEPKAWAAFAVILAALAGFELAGHVWLPRA